MLLGVVDNSIEEPTTAIVLNNTDSSLPLYTPVIVSEKYLHGKAVGEPHEFGFFGEDTYTRSIKGLLYFPTPRGHHNRSYHLFQPKILMPIDPKEIINNRCVKEIDEFKFKYLGKIQEFIQERGAITFTIKDQMQAALFMKNIGHFKKEYPYTAYYGNINGSDKSSDPGDTLTLVITMYDLSYAIPVYSKKRSRGMAVSVTMVWTKRSESLGYLSFNHEIHFVVNSYADNLLTIDGARIQDKSFVTAPYIDHFIKMLA
jgi:hypothetical protein